MPSLSDCSVVERCKKYYPRVTREARYHIGIDAPAHYFMGQIEQESRCDEGVTAFDGGMGLGQFMPETAKWMQVREKELQTLGYNPYDPAWSIRALILYDAWLQGRTSCKGWYFAFRAYNGGAGLLNREISRARSCEPVIVEKECRRKVLKLKNGRLLDLCKDVNVPYSYLIFKKAEKYK